MSADNWMICPNCRQKLNAERDKQIADVGALYGKIPAEEYITKAQEVALPRLLAKETFREDYEIGISANGVFSVSYRGGCDVCHAAYSYKCEDVDAMKKAST